MFSPRSNDDVTPTERNPFDADISELLASKENWSSTEKGGGNGGMEVQVVREKNEETLGSFIDG